MCVCVCVCIRGNGFVPANGRMWHAENCLVTAIIAQVAYSETCLVSYHVLFTGLCLCLCIYVLFICLFMLVCECVL